MAYYNPAASYGPTITGTEIFESATVPSYFPVVTPFPFIFPCTINYCPPIYSPPICCVTSVPYQSYVTTNPSGYSSSSCTTIVPNQIIESTIDNKTGMAYTASNGGGSGAAAPRVDNFGNTINADGSINAPWVDESTPKKIIIHDREKVPPGKTQYTSGTPTPLQFGSPCTQGRDPGVQAVSQVLFEGNGAFRAIPLCTTPTIFRRRKGGDCSSQWSNAFASKVDPCECPNAEVGYNAEIEYTYE